MRRLLASFLALALIAPTPVAAERFRAVAAPKTAPGIAIPHLGPAISLTTSMTTAGPSNLRAHNAVAPAAQPAPRGATAQQVFALTPRLEKTPERELNSAFDHAFRPSSSQEAVAASDLSAKAVPRLQASRLQRLRRSTVAVASAVMFAPLSAFAFFDRIPGGYNPIYETPKLEPAASSGLGGQIALLVIGIVASIAVSAYALRQLMKPKNAASRDRLARTFGLGRKKPTLDDYRRMQDPPHVQDAYQHRDAPHLAARVPHANQQPAALPAAEPKKIKFADVAGQEEAKGELAQVVDYLKDPSVYRALGAKGFKGVMLFGPPGTGKTLLAQAVANEAGAAFFHANGSDFVNKYVGVGPDNIRNLFAKARASGGPAIIFIDEIDGIGKKRSEDGGGNSEYELTLNALLSEIDGFKKDNIVVIAATNRPDMLDPALMRGRRFGLKVPVGLPDVDGRAAIFKVHAEGMRLAPDVDLRKIAEQTPGLAGADIAEVANDAAMLAAKRKAAAVEAQDFTKAVDRLMIGHERKLVMSKEERQVVAYHESGHALVSHLLKNADPVRKVTIVPHGLNALGLMQAVPEEEKHLQSRAWLVDKIAVALGGRAAEKLMTGEIYSGASNDLEQASRIARYMVMKLGMTDALGLVSYDFDGERPSAGRAMSERTRRKIDAEVDKIISEGWAAAWKVVTENKAVLQAMHDELMAKETLRGEDLDRLIPNGKKSR